MCETICYPQERRIGNPAYEYRKLKECEVSPEVFGLVDRFINQNKKALYYDTTIIYISEKSIIRTASLCLCILIRTIPSSMTHIL